MRRGILCFKIFCGRILKDTTRGKHGRCPYLCACVYTHYILKYNLKLCTFRGVILQHDHFGTHLDKNGKTIDDELELQNFEHAGTILAELWSAMVIDSHPTIAEYVTAEATEKVIIKSEEWKATHVRQSQYLLQIVKCEDKACCETFESSYLSIVNDRFLPPPLAVAQTKDGLLAVVDDKKGKYLSLHQNLSMRGQLSSFGNRRFPKGIPYDFSNPAVKDVLQRRICPECGLYFGAIGMMESHYKECKHAFLKVTGVAKNAQRTEQRGNFFKVRPTRIAAKRGQEVLCALHLQELEWLDMDDVDIDGYDIPEETRPKSGTPVLDNVVQEHWFTSGDEV